MAAQLHSLIMQVDRLHQRMDQLSTPSSKDRPAAEYSLAIDPSSSSSSACEEASAARLPDDDDDDDDDDHQLDIPSADASGLK
jgi:hypothetical protein